MVKTGKDSKVRIQESGQDGEDRTVRTGQSRSQEPQKDIL
jgi:hypothetical protein